MAGAERGVGAVGVLGGALGGGLESAGGVEIRLAVEGGDQHDQGLLLQLRDDGLVVCLLAEVSLKFEGYVQKN